MEGPSRDVLGRFCARVQELLNSRFMRDAVDGGVKFQMTWKRGGPLGVGRVGPDEEAAKSFLLDLRFFLQDNEPISIRNVARLVAESTVPHDLKERFENGRRSLNQRLDSPGPVAAIVDGTSLTRRTILETFLYGLYAHENKRYARALQTWRNGGMDVLLRSEFDNVVLDVVQALHFLQTVGREMLESA